MNYTFAQYRESADALQAKLGGFRPKVAMILGSGLGYLGDLVEDAVVVPYGEIPHFKQRTAGLRPPGRPAGGRDAGSDPPLRGILL